MRQTAIVVARPSEQRRLTAIEFERGLGGAVRQARQLAEVGLLSTPFVLSLRLQNVAGVILDDSRKRGVFQVNTVVIPGELLARWTAAAAALASMVDVCWQAAGVARSRHLADERPARVAPEFPILLFEIDRRRRRVC